MTAAHRVLFLNENIGGHTTVHANLEAAFSERSDLLPSFVHLPPRGLLRKIAGAPLPVLGNMDLDLQPLRAQIAGSAVAWRILRKQGVSRSGLGFDAVHVYTQNAALLSGDLLRSGPSVITTDSTSAVNLYRLPYRAPTRFTPYSVKVGAMLERRALNSATLVVANSQWVSTSLRSYGLPADRIRVVRFGVAVPLVVRRDPVVDRPRITFVGYSLERKGGNLLMELHQRHLREMCELIMVTTEAVEPRLGVTVMDHVRPRDGQLEEIMAQTSVFVFPSPIDQSPNVVLEAMAHGVPVIAARVAGVPEMVADGITGLLVEPGDAPGLLAAIKLLLADSSRAEAMGAAGREAALTHYDIKRTAGDLIDILAEGIDMYPRVGPIRR